jgi:hypothetical protein
MKRKSKRLYLVLHHEIFCRGQDAYHADEMVFHVASTLEKALKYIRESHVEPYSWWEIQLVDLDGEDWPERIGLYGRRGGELKKAPFEKAVQAYKRCKQDPAHHLNL